MSFATPQIFNKIKSLNCGLINYKWEKMLAASPTHLWVFHAATTSFSDLSKSSFVCFLAGLAGQADVVCSAEPQ